MVRVITQETFDEVVKENITEFEMTAEEAAEDAIKQFEAQGVDLSNIVKEAGMDYVPNDSRSNVTAALEKLGKLIKYPSGKEDEIVKELIVLKEECDKSIAHKVFAANKGSYNLLVDILEVYTSVASIVNAALDAVMALTSGHPDILDRRGFNIIIRYLECQDDVTILKKTLEWTKMCCVKHEQNRQDIFSMRILPHLKKLLEGDPAPEIVKHVCAVARALVLDDDIRVSFGKSHEHARELASEILCTLTDLLQKYRSEKDAVSDIILTLSALVVRNEFCQKVDDAGGLTFVMDIFIAYPESEKLNRQCLKLLKGLAGNDDVKVHIVTKGLAPLITTSMNRHQASAGLVGAGCATVAALSLRCPSNSKALYDAGAPEVILQGMRIHHHDSDVQKQGSWAIRNIVSRDKSLCRGFLKLGAEDVLRAALRHGKKCDYDVKAALRDLGCSVE